MPEHVMSRNGNVVDFTKDLADLVEQRLSQVQLLVKRKQAAPRSELASFVWGSSRRIWKVIDVQNPQQNQKRRQTWEQAKGMLKELIDFEKWNPSKFTDECVKPVEEDKVAEVLENYLHFILTGVVKTRHTPPKLLGETDEMLCVDKPAMFTCNFGGGGRLPPISECQTATQLLNSKGVLQIHEYLALKFDYESARETKEFWKKVKAGGHTEQECWCGKCSKCARMQSGCCNRLDKETSGVMVAAKTLRGFPKIRQQFESNHSLEEGGTEKYYLALVRGEVRMPKAEWQKSTDWKVEPCSPDNRRARIEIAMYFDKSAWKSRPWNDGSSAKWNQDKHWNWAGYPKGDEWEEGREQGESNGRQKAITFYEPVAWFCHKEKSDDQYTLLHLQIITGRTHQIRFHCSQIGHCLVGDCHYGAPLSDKDWAKRMCLHSYKTKFMEPFSDRWYEAVSPLPHDLGNLMSSLQLQQVQEGCPVFLSRRQHPPLQNIFKPYDPTRQLLQPHEPPHNASAILEANSEERQEARWHSGTQQNSWHWNHQKSWNDWSGSWQDASWGTAVDEDEDEESWGRWKSEAAEPTEAPEPPEKRPRTDSGSSQGSERLAIPETPQELGQEHEPSWKRMESTRQRGFFYYLNMSTLEQSLEPPAPWQRKLSRNNPDTIYYWNPVTNKTSLEKPQI